MGEIGVRDCPARAIRRSPLNNSSAVSTPPTILGGSSGTSGVVLLSMDRTSAVSSTAARAARCSVSFTSVRFAATRWPRSSRSCADQLPQSSATICNVAVSRAEMATVAVSASTAPMPHPRGFRIHHVQIAAPSVPSAAVISVPHPGAFCQVASAMTAPTAQSTHAIGHWSSFGLPRGAGRAATDSGCCSTKVAVIAAQYPASARMAKGYRLSSRDVFDSSRFACPRTAVHSVAR